MRKVDYVLPRLMDEHFGNVPISVVDNILDMKYFRDVLPMLARGPESYDLFYEFKANL